MIYEPSWLSVLPPVLAIVLAIISRQVILSLAMGIWLGYSLLHSVNPLAGLGLGLEGIVAVFTDPGDARILMFALMVGGLIATIEKVGGVRGFIAFLARRRWLEGAKPAQWLAFSIGIVVFVESTMTLLIAGAIARPLFDKYRISREKLAYIIDATSAPICILIPLNAWGAVIISLLVASNVADPIEVFIGAILFSIWRNVDIGPMRAAQQRTQGGEMLWPGATPMVDPSILSSQADVQPTDKARFMIVPIGVMVLSMPLGLYVTGDGSISAGSGSTAVLWAVMAAIGSVWLLVLLQGKTSIDSLMNVFLRGAGGLLPVGIILLLALALGDVANLLGTGAYIAQLTQDTIPQILLLPMLFLISGVIAFSIGSSWGTFAIMIPLAMQIALSLDLSTSMFLAAVLSGAIFGDHASPISDTTVVASMAAATDHIDHVRTQLPYALISAAIALLAFLLTSFLMK
jgi:tetracycline resistance efflux pump